ncbi:acyl-CoA dehydrogenase [Aquabacterium sp.]|uniref:acyl-CoA dehydrogenase n=1 Tax=Aquabacterium sp. TaxID=1872578 RepID=UPI0025C5ED05|nr:acyl-CoA dehydrogenase [Aquabacterium sp.]
MTFRAPVKDQIFCIKELAGLDQIAAQIPAFEDAGVETAQAVLEESAKFNEGVVAPLNWSGDQDHGSWDNGVVKASPGFKEAYKALADGGWQGLQQPLEYGGQGLPKTIGTACIEQMMAANLSFSLCSILTSGAIEALITAGSDELKTRYIPKMITGEWTGTMNLTEPQAGSDLALVRSKAVKQDDGSYRISGQKIFITYGEHDMSENIVHLVLARTPDAPEGVKGISLFVVPKFMVNADGSLGARNDVYCASIEEKLGIKASPTAVLVYGDDKGAVGPGAIGYIVGEENRGLEYMFIMMNAARFDVGVQGIGVSERAYQHAVAYARDRVQSRPVDGSQPGSAAIIHHPDVKRMLMTMRALTESARAMAIFGAAAYDNFHHHPDAEVARQAGAVYEFLVPLIKGFSTENANEVTSLGVQVHGGMGFIEETGAAQYYRDARILAIYEGTTAIQANDLIGRKTARDTGAVAKAIAGQIADFEGVLASRPSAAGQKLAVQLKAARESFLQVVDFVLAHVKTNPNAVFAGSVPYLMLTANLVAGWQMARALVAAEDALATGEDAEFMAAKIATARFYGDHILARVASLRDAILDGGESVTALALEAF